MKPTNEHGKYTAPKLYAKGEKKQENKTNQSYQIPQTLADCIFNGLSTKSGGALKLILVLCGTKQNANFEVHENWLLERTGLSKSGLNSARKILIEKGWITYKEYQHYIINYDVIYGKTTEENPVKMTNTGEEDENNKKNPVFITNTGPVKVTNTGPVKVTNTGPVKVTNTLIDKGIDKEIYNLIDKEGETRSDPPEGAHSSFSKDEPEEERKENPSPNDSVLADKPTTEPLDNFMFAANQELFEKTQWTNVYKCKQNGKYYKLI